MTQVVTVSAVTAAYASQPLRPSARVSGSSPAERSARQLKEETMLADDGPMSTRDISGAAAMTLFFLTAGQNGNHTLASRQHAEDEYLLNNLDETLAPPKDDEDSEESFLADIPELASPVFALPDLSGKDSFG